MAPGPRVGSTIWAPGDPEWTRSVRLVDSRGVSYLALLRRAVQAARDIDVLIVNGAIGMRSGYRDLVAAVLVRRLRPSTWILVSDATWEPRSRALARFGVTEGAAHFLARSLLRALDGPRVVYCVLSQAEKTTFTQTWGVPSERLRFTPFCVTLTEAEQATQPRASLEVDVFCGGNSLRDHDTVIAALRETGATAFLATSAVLDDLPPGVTAAAIPHPEFVRRMASARVVVVAMEADTPRSAGQQTYLNALALGRPLIVTDTKGVTDHVRHGQDALVVPPHDSAALATAVRQVLEDPGLAARLAQAGRTRVAQEHTLLHYTTSLREVAVALVGQPGS